MKSKIFLLLFSFLTSQIGFAHTNFKENISGISAKQLPYKYIQDIKSGIKKDWEINFYDVNNTSIGTKSKCEKYFSVIRKRNTTGDTYSKDVKSLQIKFKSSDLQGYNNWNIFNAETNQLVGTFAKENNSFVNLDVFRQGEAKEFYLAPVMHSGGHFTANEYLSDDQFVCPAPVYTDGYDLTIVNGCIISFVDSAKVVMEGGAFFSGFDGLSKDLDQNYLQGYEGGTWPGIIFEDAVIDMNYTHIYDVRPITGFNIGYSLYIRNCPDLNITYCTINTRADSINSGGGITVVYSEGIKFRPDLNIQHSSIWVNWYKTGMYIISYSPELEGDFFIGENHIENNIGTEAGIILHNVLDPVLYYNSFVDWSFGVYAYHADVNLWANYITSYVPEASLLGQLTSNFDLSSDAGGYNTLATSSGVCIRVTASYFYTRFGGNVFQKEDTVTNDQWFFEGSFQGTIPIDTQDARQNCFTTNNFANQLDSVHIKHNVVFSNTTPVKFRLLNFNCTLDSPEKQNLKGASDNMELPGIGLKSASAGDNIQAKILNSQTLYSEMKADRKKKDYSSAADKCKQILELGLQNMHSIDAVRKLFNSATLANYQKSSSLQNSVQSGLISYYESYIRNHPANMDIIKEMYYYIQKCKVNLGQYESALQGYKAMMDESFGNTYKYLAKWEYESLRILMSSSTDNVETQRSKNNALINMMQDDFKNLMRVSQNETHEKEKDNTVIAYDYKLDQNYPNPFNPVTNIQYSLPKEGFVSIKVYDVIGRMVKELVSEFKPTGNYSVTFDATNFSSGIYFYRLESANFVDTKRMVLIK